MKKHALLLLLVSIVAIGGWVVYRHFITPTRILVVNALKAQQADLTLNNDSRHIDITCIDADEMQSLDDYDAVIVYARRIFLTDGQTAEIRRAAERGIPIFTKTLRTSDFVENHNLTAGQADTLQRYFDNENRQNYRNGLRYLRHLATPHRWGDQQAEPPVDIPRDMYYHRQYGHYFTRPDELTDWLRAQGIYREGGPRVALISGITFPMEGNRQHVDTLITMLTRRGINVYPMVASGKSRERMLRQLRPDAIVYLPMGRIGNDTLVNWLHEQNIALFCPFPLSATREEWQNPSLPMSSGSKNARIVIPEIDGGMAPYAIATQNPDQQGRIVNTAEEERCRTFCEHTARYLALRTKPNSEKRIAIGFFRRPGNDALIASGMEVIPSMYNLLLRLRREGYDVSGLPATLSEFARQVKTEGLAFNTDDPEAQRRYLAAGHPLWLPKTQYEQWAAEVIPPEKYAEVTARYGPAPGQLLTRGDSIAVACLHYGNILLFPQPRPALGDDDFRIVHGAEVAPPHSYLAPYLYMQRGFRADALIHFGTHGNLEFTPGRDAGMRPQDWSHQLIGATPHFYYYTTSNIGEAVIAKRRSHAVLLTYLTPPYAESGMRQKYAALHERIHKAGGNGGTQLKAAVISEGFHRTLGIDSSRTTPLTQAELQRLDAHIEELMDERMQGAYYTLGQPYTEQQLAQTARAISDDAAQWPRIRQLLQASTEAEINNMVRALSGGAIAPAPGGDPVLNDNVLPTGRNMFSINPDNTPDPAAWEDGKRMAEQTLADYRRKHGCYPRKVSYTFWAGEFIASGGATIAQALWMLGVEPERDSQGRVGALRLVPAEALGRPRIDVMVQVSGQLRDIADSRLRLITEAIRMASAQEQEDSNYVRQGTLAQERRLIDKGIAPKEAREMAALRVFGPVNNGYSTGMMNYIERSGKWSDTGELVDGYLNNMCAAYGDEAHWGTPQREVLAAALQQTDITVQPRQSNTWGPLSLDHGYEFTGGLSMAVKALTGKEPDALMADYRNSRRRKMQRLNEAIDIEVRTTLLNPNYIRERMRGDEGTAQMFGEAFRNIFGWSVTRPSALDSSLYNQLYRIYIADEQQLGIREFFSQKNPAAYASITSTMLESARKGYWKASDQQLRQTARLADEMNRRLADMYRPQPGAAGSQADKRQATVLEKQQALGDIPQQQADDKRLLAVAIAIGIGIILVFVWLLRKRHSSE